MSSCNVPFISVKFKKKTEKCGQIIFTPPNNNFHEHYFSGSVVVSWVHQTNRRMEGTIFIGNLQEFKHAYMVIIFVGPIIIIIIIIIIIWFVRLLALRPLMAYCASLG
jgi:magnesium-transporting ATPase (P-type)